MNKELERFIETENAFAVMGRLRKLHVLSKDDVTTAMQMNRVDWLKFMKEKAGIITVESEEPGRTDKDRIKTAFDKLRKGGIYARMNYLCCTGCACSAMFEEMKKQQAAGKKPYRGTAFYHNQDADSLDGSGNLKTGMFIAFGSLNLVNGENECTDEQTIMIGIEVKAALEHEGLRLQWDGTANQKLYILAKGETEDAESN